MAPGGAALFQSEAWRPGLEKCSAVTGLTIEVYGADGRPIFGPVQPTPLFELFARQRDLGLFAECARRCLAQTDRRPAVVVCDAHGLAVVGTSLALAGRTVGAAVAGYALTDFPHPRLMKVLAHDSGLPFESLWSVVRKEQPRPERRLVLVGELLQVLGDAVLKESDRARQFEQVSAQLADAVRARDAFLATASHELRTPLTSAVATVRLLRKALAGALRQPPEVLVDIANRNLATMAALVNDLLDASKLVSGPAALEREPVEVADAVSGGVSVVSPQAVEKGVTLEVQVLNGLRILADPPKLEQVLVNLLANAVKFTPPRGTITVDAQAADGDVLIRVRDTGQGIAREYLERVFEPFFQMPDPTDQPGCGRRQRPRGTGLGLAICRQIVTLHGGRVWAESDGPGRGSTFLVSLPRAEAGHEAA
jgi:signal transduction histidine kinase